MSSNALPIKNQLVFISASLFAVFSFLSCKKEKNQAGGDPVVCNMTASFTKTINASTVTFINTSGNFSVGDSIQWAFGDGMFSYEWNPVHTYNAAGTYNVCLRVKKTPLFVRRSFVIQSPSTLQLRDTREPAVYHKAPHQLLLPIFFLRASGLPDWEP